MPYYYGQREFFSTNRSRRVNYWIANKRHVIFNVVITVMALVDFTSNGLYCSAGDFYIDPWKPVHKAIITHAHSDHARWGSDRYLCHTASLPLLKLRLGDVPIDAIQWNEAIHINGVKVSLHPAGHIIGSSQIRIEYNNEVWVVSGDYKTEDDGISCGF
jgi:putative mRNA 3-end processing factor